jgi:putative transposase
MINKNFSQQYIQQIFNEREAGKKVKDICQEHKISTTLFYKWRKERETTEPKISVRLSELERENALLKKLYLAEKIKLEYLKESLLA